MRTTGEFAEALLDAHAAQMDPSAVTIIGDDLRAGECAVAAISVIEVAPNVTAAELDVLERLGDTFDAADRRAAEYVIAKRRPDGCR